MEFKFRRRGGRIVDETDYCDACAGLAGLYPASKRDVEDKILRNINANGPPGEYCRLVTEWVNAVSAEIKERERREAKMSEAKTTPAVMTGIRVQNTGETSDVLIEFSIGQVVTLHECYSAEEAEREAAAARREYGLEPEHKACPFCGSGAFLGVNPNDCGYWVECKSCEAQRGDVWPTEAEAWAAWDKRAE